MKASLQRKTVRIVHGHKIVRLRIDIPFDEVEDYGDEGDDLNEWLDVRVSEMVNIDFSDFKDSDQMALGEVNERV